MYTGIFVHIYIYMHMQMYLHVEKHMTNATESEEVRAGMFPLLMDVHASGRYCMCTSLVLAVA